MTSERLLAQDFVLVAGLAVSLYAVVTSASRYRRSRSPWDLVAGVIATFAGVLLITWTWPQLLDMTRPAHRASYPGGTVLAAAAFLAAAAVAAAAADGALLRVEAVVRRLRPGATDRSTAATAAVTRGTVVVGAVAATVTLIGLLEAPAPVDGAGPPAGIGSVEATYRLPGGPLAVAFTGPRSGYLVLYPDTVARFDVPDDPAGNLTLTTLITGLDSPRGIAVAAGHLYVTELGDLPCPDAAEPNCREGLSPVELELVTIAEARGRITRYPILPDGSPGVPHVIVDGLPVASYDHGVNALAVGPDGRIYASIGGFGNLGLFPDLAATIDHDRGDLFGTIVSFLPDGGDLRVFARGLRNVYGLTFSPDGDLYAADNDGEALNALRGEELLHIVEGGHYGYPDDGSFAPFTVRTEFPLWLLDQVASAGIAWSDDPRGVVVGSLGRVQLVELGTRPGAAGLLVGSRSSVKRLLQVNGYATTADILGDGRLLVGVFNPWSPEENALLVVSWH